MFASSFLVFFSLLPYAALAQRLEADFSDLLGINGSISFDYTETSTVNIDVDLDMSNFDKNQIVECQYVDVVDLAWHVHANWNHDVSNAYGGSCGATQTGGHLDPTYACGPASQFNGDPNVCAQDYISSYGSRCTQAQP